MPMILRGGKALSENPMVTRSAPTMSPLQTEWAALL
jgi:hypothetical protein